MAYRRSGYNARVNYYSNPSVILPLTGTPTGVAGVSDTARVITQNRFIMAANGDESAKCQDKGRMISSELKSGTRRMELSLYKSDFRL